MMKDILKAGATLFVVGALLAVAAPLLGAAVGLAPSVSAAATALGHTANPLWMGAFFGAFGAIDAGVRPLLSGLFGGQENAPQPAPKTRKVMLVISPQQEHGHNHCEKLEARRAAERLLEQQRS